MTRTGSRGLMIGAGAVATLIGAFLAIRVLEFGLPVGPLEEGEAAYDRGDYRKARSLALAAQRGVPVDPRASRLMARAVGRLGDFETALGLYGRLSERALEAEDFFVLGSGLDRQRQSAAAIAVLERGRALEPTHADILFGLAQAYARRGQLPEAIEAAGRLVGRPGWESRGSLVLGVLDAEHADPSGAASAIERALRLDPRLDGGITTPAKARKLLAGALLRTTRPGPALDALRPVLASGTDPEAEWLSGRAFLQSKDVPHAREALARAGDFGRDDPTRPEPAPFVGAGSCADCHAAIYKAQRGSRHSLTFSAGADLGGIALPEKPVADTVVPDTTHSFRREGDALRLTTRVGSRELTALVEYALGSGDRGLTMVARDGEGRARVCRVSSYLGGTLWDLTSHAADPQPGDPGGPLGRPISEGAAEKCIDCHVTSLEAARDRRAVEAADRGIGCERCHGPGGNHLAAIALGFPDPAIARPARASAEQITRLCGTCHKVDDPSTTQADPRFVRFQATTMPMSRCYTESRGAMSCVTCHNPHRNAEREPAHYEARCLSCHGTGPAEAPAGNRRAAPAEEFRRVSCPVNPASDCLKCHMPKVEGAAPHSLFTDHQIRIHRAPQGGEESKIHLPPP